MLHIKPTQALGWVLDDKGALEQFRYKETVIERDGDYGTKKVEQIRSVLTPTTWEIWRKSESAETKDTWVLHKSGPLTLGKVPLVTVYGRRTGNMMSEPPMRDVAYLNVTMDTKYLDKEYEKLYPAKDYHTLYFGEILNAMRPNEG